MSFLEVIQLIGYSTAAALHLWMGALLLRRRRALLSLERVLLMLATGIGLWHAGNLVITLQGMLGLDRERWSIPLRIADTIAVVSITFSYSFLLHVHVHFWAAAKSRTLTFGEKVRVNLSYVPALFLCVALWQLWTGPYAPMLVKLHKLILPFAIWAAYVLCLTAVTDILIARKSSSLSERRSMQTLAASFIAIAGLILIVYGYGLGQGTLLGSYLQTFANLSSLLPSALIAYYIYRYRYLELIIRESLVVASFATVVLAAYLFGIRTIGGWLTERYNLRAGAVEALLILGLALLAGPLRGWLEKRFHKIFAREAALYRDVVSRIGTQAGQYQRLPELLGFIEKQTAEVLSLRNVFIIVLQRWNASAENNSDHSAKENENGEREDETWAEEILQLSRERDWSTLEGEDILRERGYELAYPLRREEKTIGVMLIDAAPDALTPDARAVLDVLASQVAIAIEDCRLVEENLRLERKLAQGERLAALGQMAATMAHEVKNPLSAIKSIAQVMREDENLKSEYSRDLSLIVGEADRLSRSVTQLLTFARTSPQSISPSRADELVRTVVELFRAEAASRNVNLDCRIDFSCELDGERSAAVRDALSNLLLNAMQATPADGTIRVELRAEDEALTISVTDSGAGVPSHLRERIWEPFFTTKQRGTGLGLAIVRRRIEEVGGTARLAESMNGEGASFELRLPLARKI